MTGPDGDRASSSFDDRLRAARVRHGLDEAAASDAVGGAPLAASAMGVGLRVGVELVAALAVAVGIGWLIDRLLHTTPIFIGVFVLLGGAAGVMNVWRQLGHTAPPPT